MKLLLLPFILVLLFIIGCAQKQNKKKETADLIKHSVEKNSDYINNTTSWQTFAPEELDFSVRFPQKWKTEVFNTGNKQKIINIYTVNAEDSLDFPLTIHESTDLSFISIFPNGYGTELPSGKSNNIERDKEKPVSFDINMQESLAFFLENNQVWGFFIVPSSPPANWSQHGFIFAQTAVDDFEIKCFDKKSGKELEMSECDPLPGDSVVRYGEVDKGDLQTIKRILHSITFEDNNNKEQPDSSDTAKGIIITTPKSGTAISSPLEISGKARGNWYFEALIEIELLKNGKALASTVGKANGNWMSNDYVDFSATLKFPEIKEKGKAELLFRSNNPSGKKELKKSFKVPVVIE